VTLTVGVNMLWCVPGEVGGSEEYFVRQLLGLAEFPTRCDVTAFVPSGFVDAHPDVASAVRVVESGSDCRSRLRRIVVENTWLARHAKDFDLIHHGGGTMPSRSKTPSVVTIHDLQYLTYPDYFTSTKRAYLRRRVPNAARRATVITVPSRHVKASVASSFGIDPARIVVVRHGIEDDVLALFYANAAFCMFPSLYEGYGLPVVEAMQYGRPIIASNAGPVPELVDGLCPCLDPRDTAAWRDQIRAWIENPRAVATVADRLKTYRPMTWDESASRFFAAIDAEVP